MKKKLLFTAYSMGLGGIETALLNLLNRLDYNSYDVTLILEKKEGIFLDKIPKSVKVIEYKISDCKFVLFRKVVNRIKLLKWRFKLKNKFDFSCCYATYSIPGAKLALIGSKNTAFFVHSNYQFVYENIVEYKKFFDDRRISKFKKVVFVSEEAKNYFVNVYSNLSNKLIVIGNLIDVNAVLTKAKEKIDYKKGNDYIFCFVGRLSDKSKKICRCIHLISNLRKDNIECKLLIVGDGPDKTIYVNEVKKLNLGDKVLFLGAKANPYPYMKMSDCILLTSDFEGFPVVSYESLILNKKFVTTVKANDGYLNIPIDYGFLVSKDEKEMSEEVKKILKSRGNIKKIDVEKINEQKLEAIYNLIENKL